MVSGSGKQSDILPYVIVGIDKRMFAIPALEVREIVRMPAWTQVPQTPPHVRGVINLRGSVIRLLDARVYLGATSAIEELNAMIELMDARERDHVNWLHELEASIREQRPFALSKDPTQCAFGKWYYQYQAPDRAVAMVLRKFESPHADIHHVAHKCLEHAEKGEFDEALAVVEHTRSTTLALLVNLFEESRQAFREAQRELALVVECDGQLLALAIDRVESVESIDESSIEEMEYGALSANTECLRRVAKRGKNGEVVFLFDTKALLAVGAAAEGAQSASA